MATLLAHIKIVPGQEARFERVAQDMYRHTHGDEADVRRYEYWRGAEPGTYYCLESFPDLLAFLAHQTSDHHEAHGPDFRELIADLRIEWVDPLPDASPLVPTRTAALPADASDLVRAYHERFAAVEAAWWADVARSTPEEA